MAYAVIPNLPLPLTETGFMLALNHFFNDSASLAVDAAYPPKNFKYIRDCHYIYTSEGQYRDDLIDAWFS